MALLCYLKPDDGLPDPRGPPSSHIPLLAIPEANHVVKELLSKEKTCRGAYKTYIAAIRLEIAKYVCQHGAASASHKFSHKLYMKESESTVQSIRDAYK